MSGDGGTAVEVGDFVVDEAGSGAVQLAHHRRTSVRVTIETSQLPAPTGGLELPPDHPHVVRVLDAMGGFGTAGSWATDSDTTGSGSSIVVEERRGEPGAMAAASRAGGWTGALAVTVGVLSGLDHLHRNGVVHGAIAPERILLDSRGRPRLAGVGVGLGLRSAGRRAKQAASLNDVSYLAPERSTGGEVGPTDDLYAVMLVLYEALRGERPWVTPGLDRWGELEWRAGHELPRLGIADQLPAVADRTLRSLRRDPAERPWDSAGGLARAVFVAATDDLGDGWVGRSGIELLLTGAVTRGSPTDLRVAASPHDDGTVRIAPPIMAPIAAPPGEHSEQGGEPDASPVLIDEPGVPDAGSVLMDKAGTPAARRVLPDVDDAGRPDERAGLVVAVEEERAPGRDLASRARGWVLTVIVAVAATIFIRTFILQAFSIPSESMQPTLEIGDRVAVNKLTKRIGGVNRGDVVVFANPEAGQTGEDDHLVKRVIGVGGDRIVLAEGSVIRNGERIVEPYVTGPSFPLDPDRECSEVTPCVVPEGSLWVMGDNREESADSRVIGPIPAESVVGGASWIVWPPSRLGGTRGP